MEKQPDAERELILWCLAGEQEGWEAFYREYSPYLSSVLRTVLQRSGERADPAVLQDLLQETFAALLENDMAAIRRFQPRVPLKHYLATIAAHRCIRWIERHRREAFHQSPELRVRLAAEARLERPESEGRLDQALTRLPERDRLLLRLFYWDGLPAGRIAGLAGVREDSIWTLLTRARRRLADLLRRTPLLL